MRSGDSALPAASGARAAAREVEGEEEGLGMNCPQEDELMDGLRALAAVSADEQAPPRVEERLRQAFRQRSIAADLALVPKKTVRRWPWIATAAAGSVAAGGGLFLAAGGPPPPPPAGLSP